MQRMDFSPHCRPLRFIGIFVIAVSLGFMVLMLPTRTVRTAGSVAHAQDDDFTYETEFQKGVEFMRRRNFEEALKSFKKANDMKGKKSPEALMGIAQSYYGMDAYKSAIETADKVIELAPPDPDVRAQAYNYKGLSLQAQAEMKDQKKLAEAEAAFRTSLTLSTSIPVVQYNLGVVLLQENRDPEGVAELNKFLKLQPRGPYSDPARKMIENPRRAREAYAPDFSIVTADGEHITLEDLKGKVVVLDFWGTWCPPCVASLPSLRALNKKFAKEPQFVLIGISSDSEEQPWREFTAKEKMVWPQYWDRDRQVQRAFNVRAFPTYIVIDHEGIVRYRSSGMSWERAAYLNDAIKKHVKMVAKTDAAN
ncbi:MAG TPA: redoxin domain-containing protein [Pyrinomonadaceae bacterium]|nr:redoxin domain-containing protein [Pyrinomonadaceae bacterium]